jgi:acyl transferase domain-containing protein/thioesterase domain-containing protein/acyl carrier protein
MTTDNAIAVIGLACRYPGAPDAGAYWANLRAGRDTLRRFDREELLAAGVPADLVNSPGYVPVRGVLEGGDRFDWRFFGYSPGEAATIDPQQRVFLECASTALDRASIDPARFPGWIGVYAGCDLPVPPALHGAGEAERAAWVMGYEKDFLATRVAYKLGLTGPALTVQTACSTSLVAVHTACRSLLGFECDAALAGGVSLQLPQVSGYLYREGLTRSRDGRCRPFDRDASGTVPSSGAGVVVLRRLADALDAGDDILAVIEGSAINNDGREKIGYTAPSVTGQRDCIRMAQAMAAVDPADIGYVEAHGTATIVGDPIEVTALTEAFRYSAPRAGYCGLGSVKGNLGHTGAAAGVAGLIKTALMLRHRELVPTPHFEHANPGLELEASPFRVITENQRWPGDGQLLAGVSSFGFGGTNSHLVLRSPPTAPAPAGNRRPTILCLSARATEQLRTMRADLAGHLDAEGSAPIDEVAWSLATGRRQYRYRAAWRVTGPDDAIAALTADREPVITGGTPLVGFLFPGQGTLRPGCGHAAYARLPAFRDSFDEISDLVASRYGIDLGSVRKADTEGSWFTNTEHQQLGLFAIGYSLARQFQAWDVAPAAMAGHSIGEYVAAAVSGVWDLPDALRIVRERGRAMQATNPGLMVALTMPAAQARSLVTDRAVALAVEEPHRVVLSGDADRIAAICSEQQERGVPARLLDTERAFHSALMEPAVAAVRDVVAGAKTRPPLVPFVSNLTGDWITAEQLASPSYWADQLVGTVQLGAGLARLLESACDFFIELGPGQGLTAAVRGRDPSRVAVPMLGRSPEREEERLLDAVARLWEHGVAQALPTCLSSSARPRRRSLPGHPFEPLVLPVPAAVRQARPPELTRADQSRPGLTTRVWTQVASQSVPTADSATVTVGDAAALSDRTLDQLFRELEDAAEGARLVIAASGTSDVLGDERISEQALTLIAWTEQRNNANPGTAVLLDVGAGQPPPVRPVLDPAASRYAWRGRRWWAHLPRPVALPATGPAGTFAIIGGNQAGGAAVAAGLAACGLRIGALACIEPPGSGRDARAAVEAAAWNSVHPQLLDRDDLSGLLARFCAGLIGKFVLGQAGLAPGQIVAVAELRRRLDPLSRFPRLVEFQLRMLRDQGWLAEEADAMVSIAADAATGIESALAAAGQLGEMPGLVRVLRHVTDAYPEVFSGARPPLSVIFPDARPDFVEECIADNQVATNDSAAALSAMGEVIRTLCSAGPGRPLRILEIGGGGGGLTWPLLTSWPDRHQVEYHFTDISPLIVRRAKARASELGLSGMRFSAFDITRDPLEQGLAAGSYDLIVGYNAIHVAPSIPQALGRLGGLLAPGGSLAIVEVTAIPTWAHILWGLAPGWWDFDDELRGDSVHLEAKSWLSVLPGPAGRYEVAAVPASVRSDHIVVLATAPVAPDGDAPDRVKALLSSQACLPDLAGFVHVPELSADSAFDLAGDWAGILAACRAGEAQTAWVVTADAGSAGAQLARRRFDPGDGSVSPAWRHVEVTTLGEHELDAFSRLLNGSGLPAVLRLEDAAALVSPPEEAVPEVAAGPADPPPARRARADEARDLRDAVAATWCELLGLPGASDSDDFYELGGDSLMVVQLLAVLRDRLGAAIPIGAATRDLTFGAVVKLVEDYGPREAKDDTRLVELRTAAGLTGNNETPLFLLPPAAGSSLCYRRLAPLLDLGRPCYGIESRGLHDGAPLRRMEDIAADFIGVIREIQPRGSFLLGGWSFGAMVAHEITRQLTASGDEVGLLIGIDGFQPNTGGRPVWTNLSMLARCRSLQLQARLGLGATPLVRYRLAGAEPGAAAGTGDGAAGGVRRIGEVARQSAASAWEMPRYVAVHNANLDALLRYRPRPVDCDLVLLKTRTDPAGRAALRARLAPLYRTVTVRALPGSHWTVLDQPVVSEVARELQTALAAGAHDRNSQELVS